MQFQPLEMLRKPVEDVNEQLVEVRLVKFIDNKGITDPRMNLALEEYALKELPQDEDYLLFYINEPSIIIGKNQNTIEEVHAPYVESNGIHVVRRLSGGGAVYHDLGNLNFSFITTNDGNSFHNYRKFTQPVIDALKKLGVEAELTGRNDIQVGNRKISGNAQFAVRGRMFSHGTLLFDTEMEAVVSALKVNAAKIESKGVKSIRSRVANIREFIHEPMSIEAFRRHLLESIFGGGDIPQVALTEADWAGVQCLREERYGNWDWNYGYSPRCNWERSQRIEGVGTLDVRLFIEQGKIQDATFFGDFFGTADVEGLQRLLTGTFFRRDAVEEVLIPVDISAYFGKLEQEDFLKLLFG